MILIINLNFAIALAFIFNYNNCQCYEFLEIVFGPKLNNQPQLGQSNNCSQQTPIKLAKHFGYQLEIHQVSTKTGHILTLHRIPEGRKSSNQKPKRKRVVFINHGLLGSSDMWLIRGPEEDLPYLLADNGYDVWLDNIRGNFYSRHHEFLDPDKDADFWNFGIEETGIVDLPVTIDYILNITGEADLIFVGHSLGVSTCLILCSMKPEYNQKIKLMLALAPLAVVKHQLNPIHRFLFETGSVILPMLEKRNIHEVFPRRYEFSQTLEILCRVLMEKFCANLVSIVIGGDPNHVNITVLERFLPYYPAGTSVKLLENVLQYYLTKRFAPFNNNSTQYDLSKVTVPVSLHYGHGDSLVNKQDIDELEKRLPNVYGKFPVSDRNFNHLDFVLATNARNLLYDQLLTIINNYN